jgi:hypothetical protein
LKEVAPLIVRHFGDVFGLEMAAARRDELFAKLETAEQLVAAPA